MKSFAQALKPFVPAPLKNAIKERLRQRRFKALLSKYMNHPIDREPPAGLLSELVSVWANEGYSAQPEYLLEVVRMARRVEGPVVECGSGLTTILIGIELQRRNKKLYSLEHNPQWAARMRHEVGRINLTSVHVCETPLRNFGSYDWYDVSSTNLPSQFVLAICDGPPGDTLGGRYGLVPQLQTRLSPACSILLDDYERKEEQDIAERWIRETGASISVYGSHKPFAVLQMH